MRWSGSATRSSGWGACARRAMCSPGRKRKALKIPSLLAAQGRLQHALGHLERSLGYYQRALAIDSASTTVRAEYDQLRREHAHRLELGYLLEHFNQDDTPDPQAGFGTVNCA
jgi:hypothetical protein